MSANEIKRSIPWRRGKDVSHEIDSGGSQLILGNDLSENVASGGVEGEWNSGTYWRVKDTNLEITGGKAVWSSGYSGPNTRRLAEVTAGPFLPVTGEYRVIVDLSDYTAGHINVNSGSYTSPNMDSVGIWTFDMSPLTGWGNFHIDASQDADLSVAEVKVYRINNNYRLLDYNSYNLSFGGNNPSENLIPVNEWIVTEPIPGPITSDFIVYVKRNSGSSDLKLDIEGTLSTNSGIKSTRDNDETGWESMLDVTMTYEISGTTSPTPAGDWFKWDIAENGIMPLMRLAWKNETVASLMADWNISISFMRPM